MISFEQPGMLLLVQIDRLSGEVLGEVLEKLTSLGAINIQLLPTLTKKGRLGQLLLIDVPKERLSTLENFMVNEVGVTGWHRLPTQHVYFETEIFRSSVIFQTPEGSLHAQIVGKRLRDHYGIIQPEHSCCASLQQRLRTERNFEVPLRELIRIISEVLNHGCEKVEINLQSGTWHQVPE